MFFLLFESLGVCVFAELSVLRIIKKKQYQVDEEFADELAVKNGLNIARAKFPFPTVASSSSTYHCL